MTVIFPNQVRVKEPVIAGSISAAKGREGRVFSWQPKDWSGGCSAVIPRMRGTLDLEMKGQRK